MFILRVIAISLFLYTPSTIVSFIMGKYWNGVHHFITIVILELFALGYSAFNRSYSDTLGNKLFELALLFLTSKFRPSLKTDLSSLLNRRLLSRRLVARFLQLCSVISYRILPIISSFSPSSSIPRRERKGYEIKGRINESHYIPAAVEISLSGSSVSLFFTSARLTKGEIDRKKERKKERKRRDVKEIRNSLATWIFIVNLTRSMSRIRLGEEEALIPRRHCPSTFHRSQLSEYVGS